MRHLSWILLVAVALTACSRLAAPERGDVAAVLKIVPARFAGCEDAPDECALGGNCGDDRYFVIQNGGQCSDLEKDGGRTAECWCCDGDAIAVQNGNGGYCEVCPAPSQPSDLNFCVCPSGAILSPGDDGDACGEDSGDPPPPPRCDPECEQGFDCVEGACVCPTSGNPECGGHPCAGTCRADEVCNGLDQCEPRCSAAEDFCDGSCVNTMADDQHCGSCGQACAANEICNAGICCAKGTCL